MKTKYHSIHRLIWTLMMLLISNYLSAQNQVSPVTDSNQPSPLAVALTIIAIVLCFVIWGLGQSLSALAKVLRDKQNKITLLLILILGLFQFSAHAQTTTPNAAVITAQPVTYAGMSDVAFWTFMWVIGAEFFVIFMLSLGIKRLYAELLDKPEKEIDWLKKLKTKWHDLDAKLFTKATPIEKEADVLLDHDYDGIRELDNALPPWWKYGFYVTIVIGFIYFFNFHVMGTGKNPTDEYLAEMELARIEKADYEAQNKDKVDESNVPMADAVGISIGNELYHQPGMCASCHGQSGEGGAGPNLTDDYWIHKGSLNDIYQSIKIGYPDKGMQSWQTTFNPKQISQLPTYIKSLRGTNPPNAMPPKGDLYLDTSMNKNTVTDSASLVKSMP
jgi:cytochrome c oxidase cbb3-type subunit 3